jgi:fibronectin type 3 domain-containing protein
MSAVGDRTFVRRKVGASLLVLVLLLSTVVMISTAPEEVEAARVSPIRADSNWAIEIVDGEHHINSYTSLRMDSCGNMYIAYVNAIVEGDQDLMYATNAGGTWAYTTVDPVSAVGQCVDLEIDDLDHLHLSYFNETDGALMYATNAGGSWAIEKVDDVGTAGIVNSKVLDIQQVPHIAYQDFQGQDLWYAKKVGGTWNISLAVENVAQNGCSLALDAGGYPSIVYYATHPNSDLMIATYTGSAWFPYALESEGDVGKYPAMVSDSDSNFHVVYSDVTDSKLRYANYTDDQWHFEDVDAGTGIGSYGAICVSSSGTPSVSYLDANGMDLKFASKLNGVWESITVDTFGSAGFFSSVLSLSDHQAYVSYIEATDHVLKLATNDVWTSEVVDDGWLVGDACSMVLDPENRAHISYYDSWNDTLKYATNTGGYWHTQTVDDEGDVGAATSIALDANNKVHISYLDSTNQDLKYATNAGGSWVKEKIADVGSGYNQVSSIAIDTAGKAHIAFFDANTSRIDLRYATNAGGSWVNETVYSTGHTGYHPSLALDSMNKAHISFKNGSSTPPYPHFLMYSTNAGGSWTTEVVDCGGKVGDYSSLALRGDEVHISYYDQTNGSLKYATNAGGTWVNQTVDVIGSTTKRTSLAIDPEGKVGISYYDSLGDAIKFAELSGGSWRMMHVHATMGGDSFLRYDTGGNAHIAFDLDDSAQAILMYATDASWEMTRAATQNLIAHETSIDVDLNGFTHIRFYDGSTEDLMYAKNTGGNWQVETVNSTGTVGRYSSLKVDSSGKAYITYYDSVNGNLRYATNAGGSWVSYLVDRDNDVGMHSSLAMDRLGKLHISYYDNTNDDLMYATNAGGSWAKTTVDSTGNVGSYSSLALDSDGRPHIAYYDNSNFDLKYATIGKAGWTATTLDSTGNVGLYASIAVNEKTGKAHISYYDATNTNLKYATNAGGAWATITVDDSANVVGMYTSIAIDGRQDVHISYRDDTDQDLKYATLMNGVWCTTKVDMKGDVGRYSSIDADSRGVVHISYIDSTGGDLKRARMLAEPSPPFGLTAEVDGRDAHLEWYSPYADNGRSVTGYVLYRYHPSGDVTQIRLGQVIEYTDPDLSIANYTYKIRAVNAIGLSANSNAAVASILPEVPLVPLNLLASPGDTSVMLTWSPPIGDGGAEITSYRVYRGLSQGAEAYIGSAAGATQYWDQGLEKGQTYYYRVSAVNWMGEGPLSGGASAMPASHPSSPRNLTAEKNGNDVVLNWERPEDDGGYDSVNYSIYRGGVSGSLSWLADVSNVLTYTDPEVDGVMYYHVRATNPKGGSEPSNEACSDPDLPTSPTLYGEVAGGGITLTWTEPEDHGGSAIIEYRIYRGTDYGYLDLLAEVGDARTYLDEDVVVTYTYLYQVSAVNAQGEGARSQAVSVQMGVVPSEPLNLTAIAGNGTVSLAWEEPSDPGLAITNYRVYRGMTPEELLVLTTLGNVLVYTDDDVVNGVAYHYKVSAINSVGEGYRSEIASAIPSGTPGAPLNLRAMANSTGVLLEWDPPASDGGSSILNYSVYRGEAADSLALLGSVGNATEYHDTTAIADQVYFYRVKAMNANGEGPFSETVKFDPSLPTAPDLSAELQGGSVSLTWVPPVNPGSSPISGYKVYRGMTSGALVEIASIGNVTSYTDANVSNGKTYFYRVAALNGAGEGQLSNEASVSVGAVPTAPLGLMATAGSANVSLTWDAPEDDGGWEITAYRVYRGNSEGSLTLLITLGNVTAFVDNSVTNGQTYYYKVSAVNEFGEGPASEIEDATPTAGGGGDDGDGGDSTTLYIIIAVVAIAALAGAAFFLMKRKG